MDTDNKEVTVMQHVYCLCGADKSGGFMLECTICKEWFHSTCVHMYRGNLPDDENQNENTSFVCSLCSDSLQPELIYKVGHITLRHTRSINFFRENSGRFLPLLLPKYCTCEEAVDKTIDTLVECFCCREGYHVECLYEYNLGLMDGATLNEKEAEEEEETEVDPTSTLNEIGEGRKDETHHDEEEEKEESEEEEESNEEEEESEEDDEEEEEGNEGVATRRATRLSVRRIGRALRGRNGGAGDKDTFVKKFIALPKWVWKYHRQVTSKMGRRMYHPFQFFTSYGGSEDLLFVCSRCNEEGHRVMKPVEFYEKHSDLYKKTKEVLHNKVVYLPEHEKAERGIDLFRQETILFENDDGDFISDNSDEDETVNIETDEKDEENEEVEKKEIEEEEEEEKEEGGGEEEEEEKEEVEGRHPPSKRRKIETEKEGSYMTESEGHHHSVIYSLRRREMDLPPPSIAGDNFLNSKKKRKRKSNMALKKRWGEAGIQAKYDLYALHEGENPWFLLPSTRMPLFVVGTSIGRIHAFRLPSDLSYGNKTWTGERFIDEETRAQQKKLKLYEKFSTARMQQEWMSTIVAGSDIACLEWGPDERSILSCSWGKGNISLFDTETGSRICRFDGHTQVCRSFCVDKTNPFVFLSTSHDKTMRLWDRRLKNSVQDSARDPFGQRISSTEENTSPNRRITSANCWRGHTGKVVGGYFVDGLPFIISGSSDKTVRVWDQRNSKCLSVIDTGHALCSLNMRRSNDNNTLPLLSANVLFRKMLLFDANSLLCAFPPHPITPHQVLFGHKNEQWGTFRSNFSSDGRCIATGSEDGRGLIWDSMSGEVLNKVVVSEDADWVWDAAFGWDDLLLLCAEDGTITVLG